MRREGEDLDISQAMDRDRLFTWSDLAAIALILVEISWVLPWVHGLLSFSYIAPALASFGVLFLIMFLAYALNRLFDVFQILDQVQLVVQVVVFFAGLILMTQVLLNPSDQGLFSRLLSLQLDVLLLLGTGLWLWWRGMRLSREWVDPTVTWGRVRFGLVMHVIYIVGIRPMLAHPFGLGILAVFLFFALLSMSVARVASISQYQGATETPFERSWLAAIFASVSGVVAVATLLAVLLTGQLRFLLDLFGIAARGLAAGILFLFSIPWLIISYLLEPFLPQLQQYLTDLQLQVTPISTSQFVQPTPVPQQEVPPTPAFMAFLPYLVTALFWVLLIILVVFVIRKGARRFSRRRRLSRTEVESMLGEGDFLRMLRDRFRNQMQAAAGEMLSRLQPRQRQQAAARVRQIYADLMLICQELGRPRPPSSTPLEFLPELKSLFPSQGPQLELVTAAYVRVRYGELPETQQEVDALEKAWARIQEVAQQIKANIQATAAE